MSTGRKARLRCYPSPGVHNALWYFPQVTGGYLRVLRNAVVIQVARYVPVPAWKNWLYRRLGMRVGTHATVGLMVMIDIFFPQDVELGDNCIVGYNTTVLCHEFMRHEWRRGKVVIERDATIGANCTVLPGVVVGAGATVSAMSLINRDIPPGALAGGVPVQILRAAPDETQQQGATENVA